MTKRKIFTAMAALFLPLAAAGCAHPRPVVYAAPPPPQPAMSPAAQQGYHDGFLAARRDMRHELPPDVRRHPRFRKPPVPPPAMEEYRQGFRAGYRAAIHGAPGPGY